MQFYHNKAQADIITIKVVDFPLQVAINSAISNETSASGLRSFHY